ncbi:DUF6507 family protein [Streptantibioticus rubrisoli]|uniref:DUF6507 family protein n=1 Tax=Streptantibioticus rubrisoli TaxID=1387313 RepID=A0ABT1PME6_9ACTN|nr:DUF6507 family protein [Streptantibioticus rubrisoli]MCQ4045976.1 DUF6507 family protein [Streptantibioticus rubrisoli]
MASHPAGVWNIDVHGVGVVVGKIGDIAKGLKDQVTSYGTHLQNAAKDAGTISKGGSGDYGGKNGMGLVALALSNFAEATKGQLEFMAERAGASLTGAVDATKAYITGDLEMAAQAQSDALKASTTPPPVALPPSPGGRKK